MNMTRINYVVCNCVYMNVKVSVVFNRNCLLKMEDFSRLGPPTGSHLHRKSGSIKEMMQDRRVVTA